jgi:hypothetical protein
MFLGWETTGRMWGHVGDWPVQEPTVFSFDFYGFSVWR